MIDKANEAEMTAIDAWRAADRVSILEPDEVRTNAKAIREALEKLEFALAKIQD
jgi:hypothetical protein